ncbi:MAG TPA: glutaredoxin family protein [Burkholderiaceae bacterium]|nr:glutaredoxin family protein [Burkholderiaceae bacterium]
MSPAKIIPAPRPATASRAMLALLLVCAAWPVLAQYKVVAPDGSVTYTDRPPAGTATGKSTSTAAAPAMAPLPTDLREPAARFPVTLYATQPCVPCDQARQWLKQRGVPFNEYSIDKPADVNTLKTRFGDSQLPVVTIGGQVLKGYSSADMQAYADAAGYPKENRLGAYKWPSAMPLAPPAQAVTLPAPPPVAPPPPSPPPPPRTGIQF